MINCPECAGIIDTMIQTEADAIFNRSVVSPTMSQATTFCCSSCGRKWLLGVETLQVEDDYIPEGAVLIDDKRSEELTELEIAEAAEHMDESLIEFLKENE